MATQRGRGTTGGRSVGATAAVVVGVAVIGLALVVWVLFFNDDESAGPDVGVTVEDLAAEDLAETYLGEVVTVSGEVRAPFAPGRAYWIGDEGVIGGDSVLVIAPEVIDLDEDTLVQVTGVVRELDATELADVLDVAEDEFGPLADENVVYADTIEVLAAGD